MSFTELKTRAMRLRPAQRAKLVSFLLETLDQDDEVPLTLEELDLRSEELRSGKVKGVSPEEMIGSARERLCFFISHKRTQRTQRCWENN